MQYVTSICIVLFPLGIPFVNISIFHCVSDFLVVFFLPMYLKQYISLPGLEKLTNANRSVSTGNDRLFPAELMEIAYWRSMLRSNFGKKMTRVIGGNFGAFTFILPLPYFLNICLPFFGVLSTERILKHNKKYFGISANKLRSFSPTRVILFEFS